MGDMLQQSKERQEQTQGKRMFKLAHLSDVHVSAVWPTLSRMWRGKRMLGGANMIFRRRNELRTQYVPLITKHIESQQPDLVLLSGDISTTALHEEFALARGFLQGFIDREQLVIIPGNHDVYTAGAMKEKRYESHFSDCHGETLPDEMYPFTRLLGDDIAIIGLNSCVPTGLSGSWGVLDPEQINRLPELLLKYSDRFRVVMIHHFLQDKHGTPGLPRRGLRNRHDFLRIIQSYGAELILHGHEHACYQYMIPGNNHPVRVMNPGPATRHTQYPNAQGGYQIYEIEGKELKRASRFHYDPTQNTFHKKDLL